MAAEQEVLARQIPDHAAQTVVEQGGHMVAEAADVEQQEHNGGADNEIEDADDDVVDQGAVYHVFEFLFHVITLTEKNLFAQQTGAGRKRRTSPPYALEASLKTSLDLPITMIWSPARKQ